MSWLSKALNISDPEDPFVFISYTRKDHPVVDKFVSALKVHGVKVWYDIADIHAGESWVDAIQNAIEKATDFIVFISKSSASSSYVLDEISFVMNKGKRIIPILIEKGAEIPLRMRNFKFIDITDNQNLDKSIQEVVSILKGSFIAKPEKRAMGKEETKKIATSIASEKRGESDIKKASAKSESLKSLFIVHGKDSLLLEEIESYIENLGIKPIVLTKIAGAEKSLLQKFFTWSTDIKFAIVLISADDLGSSREQYELPGVGEHSLQFRARQNVILELGFFYGYLGWENVFVMYKNPDKLFPNFEWPSDLAGVVFDSVDKEGKWRQAIEERLKNAGFKIQKKQVNQ